MACEEHHHVRFARARYRRGPPRRAVLRSPRGSIPARAGEPAAAQRGALSPRGAMSRSDGELLQGSIPARAGEPLNWGALWDGLSPRERGNAALAGARVYPRAIGTPARRLVLVISVYPRASGGTSSPSPGTSRSPGLSPRERGNRGDSHTMHVITRSIPARAGEPRWSPSMMGRREVYPRASGGTVINWATSGILAAQGLSPRERGNPS